MKIFHDPRQVIAGHKPLFLTIGTFDGMHKGHQKLLEGLKKRARSQKGMSCVLTFKDHPASRLHPEKRPRLLTSTLHKILLLDRCGIDACLLLDFTKKFASQTPEAFVRDYLVKRLQVKEVHLGYRSHFGSKRSGTPLKMSSLAGKYGFSFREVAPCKKNGVPVSSTLIRDLIRKGDLKQASQYLGRPFSLLGVTVKGLGLGKELGFPTANLDVRSETVPPKGVYAVTVDILKFRDHIVRRGLKIDSRPLRKGMRGVMNLGIRPTIPEKHKHIIPEVFLLDFHRSIYGRILEVEFHGRLREERKFGSLKALTRQISCDVKTASKYF
jgi:riboflavin kinase/FMN adenylyltransferase